MDRESTCLQSTTHTTNKPITISVTTKHWKNLTDPVNDLVSPYTSTLLLKFVFGESRILAPVVQNVDNAIQRINFYQVDSAIGFPNTYPLDSDLSDG